MRIVQIAPFVQKGKGIAGVAWQLDRAFRAAGVESELFTFRTARAGRPWPGARTPFGMRALRARRVIWFSTVGTRRARAYLAERPDAVSICHSEAMIGDVYVSHGFESLALRERKSGWWRLLANPVRAFNYLHERHRYRADVHRVVVSLSDSETDALYRGYTTVRPPVQVIPNGVDLEEFRPPSPEDRARARAQFLLPDEARVAILVGHDLLRKGVLTAIEALVHAPTVLLLVVGGDAASIGAAQSRAEDAGVVDRVLFVGVRGDIRELMAASDMFLFPSRYEANALVVLEALACGLPVICTRVGYAPEIVVDGQNGWLVDDDPIEIGDRLEQIAADAVGSWSARTRASVVDYGWDAVAQKYIALAESIVATREAKA